MHESFDYYDICQHTSRNRGLYTADQKLNANDRRSTRQNPNANRNGYECPEERDYYPYWAPSPWIDIAVLSDSASDKVCYANTKNCTDRCAYYMKNTMNFNKKGYCDVNHVTGAVATKTSSAQWINRKWYNNKKDCETANFNWYEISHAEEVKLQDNNFVCAKTQYSRVNQLGNSASDTVISQSAAPAAGVVKSAVVQGVNANRFLWTLPTIPAGKEALYKSCVLRIRYNVSSADYQQWPKDAVNAAGNIAPMVDSRNNSATATDPQTPLHQDPYVDISPGGSTAAGDMFLSLKVNTNQYGRVFQDRSYVFSIVRRPNISTSMNTQTDTPSVNANEIASRIAKGGKIYNVNVRGKRGNIVQVYPSVEYDFVPDALAMSDKDMIHFQWTGSDYNPRRGCNDATGGPPDPNTFNTDANANQNSRADRSNIVFTEHMANNVPKDYLGYDDDTTSLNFTSKSRSAMMTVLENAPCYDPAVNSQTVAKECYNTILRLAYLNQQQDGGSLALRGGAACLTQTQLAAIANRDTADNHPLNCAKLNAKPYPYFNGGIMFLRRKGWFPFFSSRNNNFSNRQQIGVVCVGGQCKVDNSSGVLQDLNPATSGTSLSRAKPPATCSSYTSDTAMCSTVTSTTSTNEKAHDNDATGDGNRMGCNNAASSSSSDSTDGVNDLACGLFFVGLFLGVLISWLLLRYQTQLQTLAASAWPKGSQETEDAAGQRTDVAYSSVETGAGARQETPVLRPSEFVSTNPTFALPPRKPGKADKPADKPTDKPDKPKKEPAAAAAAEPAVVGKPAASWIKSETAKEE